jgi:hypothetical protein
MLDRLAPGSDYVRSLSVELAGVAIEMAIVLVGLSLFLDGSEARAMARRSQKVVEWLGQVEPGLAAAFKRELDDTLERLKEPSRVVGEEFDSERRAALAGLEQLRRLRLDYANIILLAPTDIAPYYYEKILGRVAAISRAYDAVEQVVRLVYGAYTTYDHYQAGFFPEAVPVEKLNHAVDALERAIRALAGPADGASAVKGEADRHILNHDEAADLLQVVATIRRRTAEAL